MGKMVKVYEFSPACNSEYDTTVMRVKEDTWEEALDMAEAILDSQYNEKKWHQIEVTIKCGYITEEDMQDIEKMIGEG